jgi:hypothetical protein
MIAETGDRINRTAYVQQVTTWQEKIVNGTSDFIKMSSLECLTRYVTFDRDVSSLLLISSNDTLEGPSAVLDSNNSLLFVNHFGSRYDSVTLGVQLWECGVSNNFSCVRPQTWEGNAALVSAWNVYGYKIDYCLSKISNLGGKCSIRFDVNIMIGNPTLYSRGLGTPPMLTLLSRLHSEFMQMCVHLLYSLAV